VPKKWTLQPSSVPRSTETRTHRAAETIEPRCSRSAPAARGHAPPSPSQGASRSVGRSGRE
jgi:hypothetical protein